MTIHHVKQGSTEWELLRLGRITASVADALLTPLFKLRTGDGVETLLYEKLSEKLLGYKVQTGSTFPMAQGVVSEPDARNWYAFAHNVDVKEVGFIVGDDERIGASPDGILPDGSGLEIKCPTGPRMLRYLVNGEVPPEYRVQIAFSMFVANAPHWTFLAFHRALPPLVVRVDRNEEQMQAVRAALESFFAKFDPLYARFKAHQDAENAAKEAAYQKEIEREMAAQNVKAQPRAEDGA